MPQTVGEPGMGFGCRYFLVATVAAGVCIPALVRADDLDRRADEATLRAAGLATDDPALVEFFRKRTLSAADRARLTVAVRRLGDHSFVVREQASNDLIAAGRSALPFLRPALTDADLEVARRARRALDSIERGPETRLTLAAARLLALRDPPGATPAVLNFLPFADSPEIEEELLAALLVVGLHNGNPDPSLAAALGDRLAVRRAAAALVLGRAPQAAQRAAVKALLTDTDAHVRLRAAQGLVAGKEKDAVPVLVALLAAAPIASAWQAEELLCTIAGDEAPPVSVGSGPDAERRKCRDAWAAWWQTHGRKLDLAALDLEKRSLGLTLIVAFDGRGNQGKVWETRSDHKPRWEITGLQGPINASMISNNRVLIAEHNGRRVTERDLKGNILWQYRVANNQYPVACQRLSNGNTFVATYNQVLEVTPAGKEVYAFPCTQGIIYSAQKRRNGRIVYVTSNGVLVELDGQGKELHSLRVGPNSGWMTVEALPRGRFLVPQPARGKVVDLDETGKTVTEYAVPNANAATRLPNGNLLVCRHHDRTVAEVTRTGKVVWEERLPGRPFWARRR
jgi:outer membrane protein assembly factor BamB